MPKLIITESQYRKILRNQIRENTMQLDAKSQEVVDDILGSLNEDMNGIIAKVKEYVKKGLMTATVLSALMAAPQLTSAQKQEIKTVASTSTTQKVDVNSIVSIKEMSDWNDYVLWLKNKKLSGDKRMNSVEFSKKVMDAYKKEAPSTTVSYDRVVNIQKAIRRYRDYTIDIFRNHPEQGQPTANVKADMSNYMMWVLGTPDDGIAGEYTSQFMFPKKYMKDLDTKKTTTTGYADPMASK